MFRVENFCSLHSTPTTTPKILKLDNSIESPDSILIAIEIQSQSQTYRIRFKEYREEEIMNWIRSEEK